MRPLLRTLRFLRPYWADALGAFLSLLISGGAGLAVPALLQRAIDQGIVTPQLQVAIWTGLTIVGVALARSIFTFLQGFLSARASQSVAYDLRNRLYAKIQSLSFSYHDRAQTGQLLTRATSDVERVRMFIGMGLIHFLSALVMMVGSLALLFITDWQLALIMLVLTPLTMGVFALFASRARPLFVEVQRRLGRLNTVLQENLAGIRVVKAFVREPHEARRFGETNRLLYEKSLEVGRLISMAFPLIFLIANLATLVVIWAGGLQVIGGQLSVGQLVAFNNYLLMTMFPMMMLGAILAMISQAAASAVRVFEILDTRSEVKEAPDARPMPPIEGRVGFEHVTFRYFESGEDVLKEVSFDAEPGQKVALLGATGSGKSTIINLIPRLYDVTEGRVTIDGIDVREVTLESLRRQIGIVLQETTLFTGTIRENISFGRPEATMEEVVAAAKAAAAHEFITSFPDGYETEVGERGVTLSGGQKQRIAIARALLMDPRILILDDFTSSVDFETELQIERALAGLMEGRTSFVIAQRISTVRRADLILVLDQGQIIARGTHEELLQESPLYAEIYSSQLEPDVVEQAMPAEVA
ncbi:MAG TPA: ABC transporter ATP-binding protein [Anaerolineae bacterium]|nr:ABC transporter ATP-binding protein [Anaerolineae bacterium]